MHTKSYYIREFCDASKREPVEGNDVSHILLFRESIDDLFTAVQTPLLIESAINCEEFYTTCFDPKSGMFELHIDSLEMVDGKPVVTETDTVFLVHHLGVEMLYAGFNLRHRLPFLVHIPVVARINRLTKEVLDSTPTFLYLVRSVSEEVNYVIKQPSHLFISTGGKSTQHERDVGDREESWKDVKRSFHTASWTLFRDKAWFGWSHGSPPFAFKLAPMCRVGFTAFIKEARELLSIPTGGNIFKPYPRLFTARYFGEERTPEQAEAWDKFDVYDKFARLDVTMGSVEVREVAHSGHVEVDDCRHITSAFRLTTANIVGHSFNVPFALAPTSNSEFRYYYRFVNSLSGIAELKIKLLEKLVKIARGQDKEHTSDDVVGTVYGADLYAFWTQSYPEKDVFAVTHAHPDKIGKSKSEVPVFRSGKCYFEKLFIQPFMSNEDIGAEHMGLYLANYVEALDMCVATSIIYTTYRTLTSLNSILKRGGSDPIEFDISRTVLADMSGKFGASHGQFIINQCEDVFEVCSGDVGQVTITVYTTRHGLKNEFFISINKDLQRFEQAMTVAYGACASSVKLSKDQREAVGSFLELRKKEFETHVQSIGLIEFSKVGDMINGETYVLTYTDVIAVSMIILEVAKHSISCMTHAGDELTVKECANLTKTFLRQILKFVPTKRDTKQ